MLRLLVEKTKIIFVPFGIWCRKGVPVLSFTSDGPYDKLRTGTLIEEDLFCDGKLRFQSSLYFGQMQEFLTNTARNGPWCGGIWDGWLQGTRDSQGPRVSWQKLPHEVWMSPSLACFMVMEPISRLHEWLKQLGNADLLQVTSLWLMGFAQWTGQSDGEVLCHSKKWWRPIIRNTHSKNHSSKSACQNKPRNYSQD